MTSVISTPVMPRRRVYVRDPRGDNLLRGVGLLTHENRLGAMVLTARVEFADGVDAVLAPDWITDVPAELADNVVPFCRGRNAQ